MNYPWPYLELGKAFRLPLFRQLLPGKTGSFLDCVARVCFGKRGTLRFRCERHLALNRLDAVGGRQTKSTAVVGVKAGESVQVQCYSPDAKINVEIDRPENRFVVDCGTRIEFFTAEMVAQAVADLRVLQGEQSSLRCQVDPLWQIDSVEALAPAEIIDWDVEGVDQNRQLVVRLSEPAKTDESVRLKILGRRGLVINDQMSVADLSMVRFSGSQNGTRKLFLQESDAFELHVNGADELNRIELSTVTVEDTLYVDPMPGGIAFVQNESTDRIGITLAPRKPQFSVWMDVDVAVRGTKLQEQCSIRCVPSGVTMDRLVVVFSPSTSTSGWQWTADRSLGPIASRQLSGDEREAVAAGYIGQVWELSWRVPQREQIELRGERITAWKEQAAVSLPSAPDAAIQKGLLVVNALDGTGVKLINRRLAELPSSQTEIGRVPTVRGTFQFDPGRELMAGDPAIELCPVAASSEQVGAWAWSCELDSRLSSSGVTSHLAIYRIQTAGQQNLRIKLPEVATLHTVWLDSIPLRMSEIATSADTVNLTLPSGREYLSVSLYFSTAGSLPQVTASYAPPFPETTVPVLSRRWRVWLPKGYELPTDDTRAHAGSFQPTTWEQRVFGPLGRTVDSPTRNPLDREFWQLNSQNSTELMSTTRLAERLLEKFGSAFALKQNAQSAITWGELLEHVSRTTPEIDFRISHSSLMEASISSDTYCRARDSKTALAAECRFLRMPISCSSCEIKKWF